MDLKAQLDELNAAVADLVASADTAIVVEALAELTEAVKAKTTEPPVVNVTVSPTPIQNVVNVPPQQPCDFEFAFTYDADGRIKTARATRVMKR